MAFERIKLEFQDDVAVLTLSHPEALNAVSLKMLAELTEAIDMASDRTHGARCLLMTGEGRAFCAGANLTDDAVDRSDGERDAGKVLEERYHPFLLKLRNLKMPFITAVNGVAAGVGMSFALMGDLVLVARSAYFLQAFKRIGLVPDGGSTFLLPRLVGMRRAMELSMLAERLPAEKALEWGLISRVHDDAELMGEAMTLAKELAAGPTVALSLIRKAYWESPENTYEQQLHVERMLQREAGLTKDSIEGVHAFVEKRPANFTGE
ncbi:MAG: enoyl-CoA hydratase/isomerase [Alphaproteobacteria bacterium]